MTIEAKIIAHSRTHDENTSPLVTFQLRYPRFIHSEFMTHRAFSRNASSSRAIPINKLIDNILDDTAVPVHWGRNKPGMQAGEELSAADQQYALADWLTARDEAIAAAERLAARGAHKQVVNRLLEPFSHISVVMTTCTDGLANFLWLRDHPDAQPEIQELARQMKTCMDESVPQLLDIDEWHTPYVHRDDPSQKYTLSDGVQLAVKLSAARCCRVSYLKHDGTPASVDEDLALCNKLIGQEPLHASPFEHQARPDFRGYSGWSSPHLHGNLPGWIQFRKTLEGEFHRDMPSELG